MGKVCTLLELSLVFTKVINRSSSAPGVKLLRKGLFVSHPTSDAPFLGHSTLEEHWGVYLLREAPRLSKERLQAPGCRDAEACPCVSSPCMPRWWSFSPSLSTDDTADTCTCPPTLTDNPSCQAPSGSLCSLRLDTFHCLQLSSLFFQSAHRQHLMFTWIRADTRSSYGHLSLNALSENLQKFPTPPFCRG